MSTQPLVSVVIPAFNRAAYLADAVRSVLAQTYRHYEIIIIDDGSTDNTPEIAAQFGDSVRYIRQANMGAAAARNHGVRIANGDLIAFLDSDDLFLPDKLEKQIACFERDPELGMVYTAYDLVGETLNRISTRTMSLPPSPYRTWLFSCSVATPTVMLRRDVIAAVGEFDQSMPLMEDVDYWIRVARQFKISLIDEPLTQVRIHPGNFARDPQAILTAFQHIAQKNHAYLSPLLRRRLAAHMRYTAGNYSINFAPDDLGTAWKYWLSGLLYWPFDRKSGLLLARLILRTFFSSRLRRFIRRGAASSDV